MVNILYTGLKLAKCVCMLVWIHIYKFKYLFGYIRHVHNIYGSYLEFEIHIVFVCIHYISNICIFISLNMYCMYSSTECCTSEIIQEF